MTNPDTRQAALDHHAAREQRLAVLGWREVSDNGCPIRLTRKWCLNDRGLRRGNCWCNSRLKDHAATYTDSRGRRFTLWEPYGASGSELADVIASATAAGLRVDITSSVWNPPGTVGISFTVAPHPAAHARRDLDGTRQ